MKLKGAFFAVFLIITSSVITLAGSGVQHSKPKEHSLIAVSGYPFYLENIQIGSPLSDYGSHFGLKASVDNDGDNYPSFDTPNRIDAKNFLNLAHYTAITSFNKQVDQSYFWFRETAPGSEEHLKPASRRSIEFYPYGWREDAGDSTLSATGWVMTIATDTFLLNITLTNNSAGAISLDPVLTILRDSDPQREATLVLGSSLGDCDTSSIDEVNNIAFIECKGTRSSKDISFVRAIRASEDIININYTPGYSFEIIMQNTTLSPGESKEIYLVLGYAAEGNAKSDAASLALAGGGMVDSKPGKARGVLNALKVEWDEFFSNLPVPHTTDSRYLQLYKMAATALRMNIYKKRNAMPADCSVPGKVHFNYFWAWDTPFHTLGQSEWDPQLAKDNLTTQFAGQGEDGIIYMTIDDNLSGLPTIYTQPPVQGWAIEEIYRKDKSRDKDWLRAMYDKSIRYLNYWEENRDNDDDGLYGFAGGLETGWDDTPRFHCPSVSNICVAMVDNIDSLDLNSWIYQYYTKMKYVAEELELYEEAELLRKKADVLAKNIDDKLWDDVAGAYFDREFVDGEYQFIRVLTPATVFPLFAGASRDLQKIKSVIEGHILNPDEFWGRYPIPTVAYNDPYYDHNDDGYYWQGQIWLITAYAALKALYRYGYEQEAEELKKRLLEMIYNADPGGIHETYDALTGEVGWGAGSNGYFEGISEPSVFQFGWSSAFTMQILLDRHQSERFLMPNDVRVEGFVREITRLEEHEPFMEIVAQGYEQPYVRLDSAGADPIIDSKSIHLRIEDPYNVFCTQGCPHLMFGMDYPFRVYLYFSSRVGETSEDGTISWLETESDSKGSYFLAKPTVKSTGIKYYIIMPQEEGCGCSVGEKDNYGYIWITLLIAGTFFVRSILRYGALVHS